MNDLFIPSARNSERWQPKDHGKAAKYMPGRAEVKRAEDRQQRINKARALRQTYWLERDCDFAFNGTPYERGCHRILREAMGVRAAENLEALFSRDRKLSGLIEGARAFESITLRQYGLLGRLRLNAFDLRYKELRP